MNYVPVHPLIAGLFATLPEPDSMWPAAARAKWFRAVIAAFDVLYQGGDQGEIIVTTAVRVPPPERPFAFGAIGHPHLDTSILPQAVVPSDVSDDDVVDEPPAPEPVGPKSPVLGPNEPATIISAPSKVVEKINKEALPRVEPSPAPVARVPKPDPPAPTGRDATRRLTDAERFDIYRRLTEGETIAQVCAAHGITETIASGFRQRLVTEGKIKATPGRPRTAAKAAAVQPEPAPAPVELKKTPPPLDGEAIVSHLVAYVTKQNKAGVPVKWPELMREAGPGMTHGDLATLMDEMERRHLIRQGVRGIEAVGAVSEQPKPAAIRVDARRRVETKPVPSEEEQIAAHIAAKGISRASEERIHVNDIIKELKDGGRTVTQGHNRVCWHLGGQKGEVYRDQLLAHANRFRAMRGAPVWDSRKVDWESDAA